MWKSRRQYYDVIRVPKARRRRDIYDWGKLIIMGGILLFIVGYIVKIYAFPAASMTETLIYLPYIVR